MNLEDMIEPECGLQQDEWSLNKPTFGKENQLEVIGWSRRYGSHKYYILKCSTCSEDSELFGNGYFKSLKDNLKKGRLPCGCAVTVQWTEAQYKVLCSRKASKLGYKFLGWSSKFNGQASTRARLLCQEHGEWGSCWVSILISKDKECGCPTCSAEATSKRVLKPDKIMIDSFFASGQFSEGTKFRRSPRTRRGWAAYWYVFCPDCDSEVESLGDNLRRGHRPCLCSNYRQQECYINWIVDENNQAIALKFGIANIAQRRVTQQNASCLYEVRNHSVYVFPDKSSCLTAERECKQTLDCSVLSKEEMPDGYTETTSVLNLGRIKQIYIKHGGILNEVHRRRLHQRTLVSRRRLRDCLSDN